MKQVHQHWDPLLEVVVGSCYVPGFFSWIKNTRLRYQFEQMAAETEEDFQQLISCLKGFGVKTHRPKLPNSVEEIFVGGRYVTPPVTPRDYFIMVGQELWVCRIPNHAHAEKMFGPLRDDPVSQKLWRLDQEQHDCKLGFYKEIFSEIRSQGNPIVMTETDYISGCFVSRIGDDLFFATQTPTDDKESALCMLGDCFPRHRVHLVDAAGHGDATYCPVCPGLIISLRDIDTYEDTFPGWEVVYLPPSDYAKTAKFRGSMKTNRGRWFLPGFDSDPELVSMVEHYFGHWVGQASETVFDVNILVVDPKNIIVSAHNDQVEKACGRYGITVHVVPFRHRYFWDAGIHCITNDLDRAGTRSTHITKERSQS